MKTQNESTATENGVPTAKELMQVQVAEAVSTKLTPYYNVFERCTQAVITELDSTDTTVEVEEVRDVINFINGYAKVIHKIIETPQVQEALIDFIIQLEADSPAVARRKAEAKDKLVKQKLQDLKDNMDAKRDL